MIIKTDLDSLYIPMRCSLCVCGDSGVDIVNKWLKIVSSTHHLRIVDTQPLSLGCYLHRDCVHTHIICMHRKLSRLKVEGETLYMHTVVLL